MVLVTQELMISLQNFHEEGEYLGIFPPFFDEIEESEFFFREAEETVFIGNLIVHFLQKIYARISTQFFFPFLRF